MPIYNPRKDPIEYYYEIEGKDGIVNILPDIDAIIEFARQHFLDTYGDINVHVPPFATISDAVEYLNSKGFFCCSRRT